MRLGGCLVAAACLLAAGHWIPCEARERQAVTISYVVGPPQPLPEGLKAVAVIDSGVKTEGARQDDRERKWSTIAADMIESMLQNGAQFGSPLVVAKRRETQKILAERDLKLAGLVEGEAATRAGKLLDVQGLITSRITVSVDIEKSSKSAVDWLSIMGGFADQIGEVRPPRARDREGEVRRPRVYRQPRYVYDPREVYWRDPRYSVDPRIVRVGPLPGSLNAAAGPVVVVAPGPAVVPGQPVASPSGRAASGGLTLKTKEVEEISRHLTVQCSFCLIDAVTGAAIVQYSTPAIQKKDRKSPDFFFGGNIDEGDLDPVDHFIGELVERATQEFAGQVVPVRVRFCTEVVGHGKAGEGAVRALRADDYAGAFRGFEAQLRKEPEEADTAYAMGVVAELTSDPVRALELYRRAVSTDGVDKEELAVYMAAKERLSVHLHRILVPVASQPASFGR
ncbi:MAG TPA: hypothetical protein PKY77_00895 [Phycisphaerae bacterium]|nr:hypothetical protein [Phycisphaerae bacterium]HRY67588.1 hypothetical protein [Phycisphaerae bacterium]HSA24975.1 hypothetical protein [Phycisphaerae bacterium]